MKRITSLCITAAVLFLLLPTPLSAGIASDHQIKLHPSKPTHGDFITAFSLEVPVLNCILSQNDGTVTLTSTFCFDLGTVTFRIVDAETKTVVAEAQTEARAEGTHTIDLSNLPAGTYELEFYATDRGPLFGTFTISTAKV